MRRMSTRITRTGRDRGATAVIVAVLMPVVLLGLGAIVIDVGSFYAERAQTQNGADAGAIAVAQTCAAGACDITAANAYAPANSNGTINTTNEVRTGFPCGGNIPSAIANPVPPCPLGSENGTICPTPPTAPTPPAASTPYIDVMNNTRNTSTGTTLVPAFLGKALLGNGYQGQTVAACAQARWGYPAPSGNTVPMTISQCEWYRDTNSGATFAAPPDYRVAPANTPWPPAFPYSQYDPKASPTQVPVVGGEDVLALHGTENVVTNGEFETTPLGWTNTPNGGNGPNVSQNTDLTFVHDGAGSLKITWKKDAAGVESADDVNQSTIAGQVYVLSGWVYVPSGQPSVRLYVKPSGAPVYSTTQSGDGAWHQLSLEFLADGSRVDIGLVSASATTSGQVAYLDTVVLALKTDPKCQGAPNPASGFDQPGGFGWIYDPNNDCTAVIDVNNTTPDNTGASMDPACQSVLQADSCDPGSEPTPPCQPKIMFVPVYDGFCSNQSKTCDVARVCGSLPSQSNGCYHIKGFAAFVPTGFQLNGGGGLTQKSSISSTAYCKGNDKCVYGFFAHELVPYTGSVCSDPACYLGIGIVTLTG
jgi:Putative Flp pilus-assembly TadE/G-like